MASSALSATLNALDTIPSLLESIIVQAETTATKARVALEAIAVAMEDKEEESDYKEPDELTALKALDIEPAEIEELKAEVTRLKKIEVMMNRLAEKNAFKKMFLER